MIELINNIIIQPLYLLFEFLFEYIYEYSSNIGLTLLLISFIVSFLCLPLYLRADELQKEELEVRKKLKKRVDSIKRNFKGDKKHFLLQTYYRQNNYHPIMGLRLSLSLLLQIPIFFAAYSFFSHLTLLNGLSGCLVHDLARPDRMLFIYHIPINVYPILMTLVNIAACKIYSKENNKSLYIMSFIFLILLYNSPAALCIYWLFNNIFSLVKNILLTKISSDKLIKYSFIYAIILWIIFAVMCEASILPIAVIILTCSLYCLKFENYILNIKTQTLFVLSLIALVILCGIYIPANVIATSPFEFIFGGKSPLDVLKYTALVFGGVFFWGYTIYYFLNERGKRFLTAALSFTLIYFLINLYMLKLPGAILSNTLTFEAKNVNFDSFFFFV